MNILITGGAGFIGSALAFRMCDKYSVQLLDKKGLGYYVDGVNVVTNILENPMMSKDQEIDVVIHCAAIISETECQKNISEAIDTNVKGTINVLQNCVASGVKKFIFLSSAAVYGDSSMPIGEFIPLDTPTIYGKTKSMAEFFVNDFYDKYDLHTTILRPFNIYGPGMNHKREPLPVISKFIRRMIFDKEIPVYGNGKYVRDYVFIDDVVDAIMTVVESDNDLAAGGTFNIATGVPTDVLRLATIIGRELRKVPKIKWLPTRNQEAMRSVGNFFQAKSLLGFSAKIGIEEGIKRTVDWFRSLTLISEGE